MRAGQYLSITTLVSMLTTVLAKLRVLEVVAYMYIDSLYIVPTENPEGLLDSHGVTPKLNNGSY